MKRREFLEALVLLASGVAPSSVPLVSFAQCGSAGAGIRFGAQTNAWPIAAGSFPSFLAVLDQIRQIGYTGFETSFHNVENQFGSPAKARPEIEKRQLTFFGVHIFLPTRLYDASTGLPPADLYRKVGPGGLALGAQHMIFSGAPAANDAALERKIAGLNAAGRYSKGIGLQLAYHNETDEEARSGHLEQIYERADPEYVAFVLDCGHAFQGGIEVPAFLGRHHSRIVGLHLRDYKNGRQAPLGTGDFPLKQSANVLVRAGWHGWAEDEEDFSGGPKHGASTLMAPDLKVMKGAFCS